MLLSGKPFLFLRPGHDGLGSVSGTEFGFGHGMIRRDCELIDSMSFGTLDSFACSNQALIGPRQHCPFLIAQQLWVQ
jgi:hypothetical protein